MQLKTLYSFSHLIFCSLLEKGAVVIIGAAFRQDFSSAVKSVVIEVGIVELIWS